MNKLIERLNAAITYWWVSLLLGILYIALAVWLFAYPLATYITLSILFAAFMLVSGVFEILFAVSNKKSMHNWGWYLAGGILDLVIGTLLVAMPGLSMEVLPLILAFWLLFRGFSGVGFSLDTRRYGSPNWGWDMFVAILSILFSIAILWLPAIGALTFVLITAYAFIAFGVFRITLAFSLKGLYKRNQELHQ